MLTKNTACNFQRIITCLRFQFYTEVTHKGETRIEEFNELTGTELGSTCFKDALTHKKKKSFREVE